jgi:hypothetical protein
MGYGSMRILQFPAPGSTVSQETGVVLRQGAGRNLNSKRERCPIVKSRKIPNASSVFVFDIKGTLENVKETIVSIRRSDSAEKLDNGD